MVERSGVLNLGVEGMMIVGAACGFAGAYLSGSTLVGALCGILAGAALAAVFGILTLGLAVNQVATGLALTIFGVGLSGLIGAGFVGEQIVPAPHLDLPVLTDIPCRRPHPVRRGCVRLFLDRADHRHLAVPLPHPRRPGAARGRRQSRLGACARLSGAAASACWRCCSAAPAPASAALILPLAYTPFFIPGMTAGRGWIALALVVFASWRPGRLVAGAYLFGAVSILQLHTQALGFGIPSQLMSSLPYLATVIVLVLISRTRGTAGSAAPASLGLVFVPDR